MIYLMISSTLSTMETVVDFKRFSIGGRGKNHVTIMLLQVRSMRIFIFKFNSTSRIPRGLDKGWFTSQFLYGCKE